MRNFIVQITPGSDLALLPFLIDFIVIKRNGGLGAGRWEGCSAKGVSKKRQCKDRRLMQNDVAIS